MLVINPVVLAFFLESKERTPFPVPYPLSLFFFESKNTFPPTIGMLNRRIHPLGFSFSERTGEARGEDVLYFDAEQFSQPQYGAWFDVLVELF